MADARAEFDHATQIALLYALMALLSVLFFCFGCYAHAQLRSARIEEIVALRAARSSS